MTTLKLDLESLLAPISPDNPRGHNMEYDTDIDAIREARVSEPDDLPQDEWSTTLRKADWQQVINLSQKLLTQKSKDLQVVCWLIEALLNQYGLEGVKSGLTFMHMFLQKYGDVCWPEPDEDGISLHDITLQWLDRQLVLPLIRLPLLGQPESTLQYWRQVQDFEHKVAMYPEKREALLNEGDFSLHSFQRWATTVPAATLAHTVQLLTQTCTELTMVEQQYLKHHGNEQGNRLGAVAQTMTEMNVFLQRIGEQVAPDYDDLMTINVLEPNEQPPEQPCNSDMIRKAMSRDLAISQMLTIAHFFRQSEPSSPVPFLMERAARWANMTLIEWLKEMLQDDNSLQNISNVLKGNDRE